MNLFIENKYTRWYFVIVSTRPTRSKKDGYFESHHIIPRALGGSNEKSNLVLLTAREHFLIHWLLTKMCINTEHKRKMYFAMSCISWKTNKTHEKIVSSWQYELEKKAMIEARTGLKHSPETKEKMRNAKLGKKQKPEHIEQRRISNTGKKRSQEHKDALRDIFKGIPHPKTTCPHCGIVGSVSRLKGHHFDRCKLLITQSVVENPLLCINVTDSCFVADE